MKRLVLAALLLASGVATAVPASAQYYGGGGGGYGGPRYDRDRDEDRPRYRRPRDDDEGYERRGPRRGSSVCVTSRGNCPIGAIVPRLAPCGCEFPGFGYKRGAAG